MTIATGNHTGITIDGVNEATILSYFRSLNAQDFTATADLFAPDGVLIPPFEEGIKGREAIANYLAAEAQGLQAQPLRGTVRVLEDGGGEYTITGRVQTPLFGVNVGWCFILDSREAISLAEVKLLASPGELFNLRPFARSDRAGESFE